MQPPAINAWFWCPGMHGAGAHAQTCLVGSGGAPGTHATGTGATSRPMLVAPDGCTTTHALVISSCCTGAALSGFSSNSGSACGAGCVLQCLLRQQNTMALTSIHSKMRPATTRTQMK